MRVSMLRVAWVPAAAGVLAATDGGGALAAFLISSKGAFERTRDEFCARAAVQRVAAADALCERHAMMTM